MKHCIIVKWDDKVADRDAIVEEVKRLYEQAPQAIEGIKYVEYLRNCVDRPNRYDLAIVIHMDREALPLWDASEIHRLWKSGFSDFIASKAIFDYD